MENIFGLKVDGREKGHELELIPRNIEKVLEKEEQIKRTCM